MAEWFGHLLAGIPGWLYLPALIIIIVIAVIWWLADLAAFGWSSGTRADLGEKRHDKK